MKDTLVIPKGEHLSHDVYMCWNIQSQTDPACAPEGKHLLTAYAPVTEDEARDKDLMNWACDQIVEYLERRYPGFTESVEWALFPVSWRLEGVVKVVVVENKTQLAKALAAQKNYPAKDRSPLQRESHLQPVRGGRRRAQVPDCAGQH
jgi:hypothetical protein